MVSYVGLEIFIKESIALLNWSKFQWPSLVLVLQKLVLSILAVSSAEASILVAVEWTLLASVTRVLVVADETAGENFQSFSSIKSSMENSM